MKEIVLKKPTLNKLYREISELWLALAILGVCIGFATAGGWSLAALVAAGVASGMSMWAFQQSKKNWDDV